MDDDQREAILAWVKDIEPARVASMATTPTRSSWERLNLQKRTRDEISPTPVAGLSKRSRVQDGSDSRSSVLRLRDDITLTSSTPTSASRQRSLSPSRAKANLSRASPRVVYVHELVDPGNEAAKELLARLLGENGEGTNSSWVPPEESIAKISAASSQCAIELRSEGSWVIKAACPLLELAIEGLPLECWSV